MEREQSIDAVLQQAALQRGGREVGSDLWQSLHMGSLPPPPPPPPPPPVTGAERGSGLGRLEPGSVRRSGDRMDPAWGGGGGGLFELGLGARPGTRGDGPDERFGGRLGMGARPGEGPGWDGGGGPDERPGGRLRRLGLGRRPGERSGWDGGEGMGAPLLRAQRDRETGPGPTVLDWQQLGRERE